MTYLDILRALKSKVSEDLSSLIKYFTQKDWRSIRFKLIFFLLFSIHFIKVGKLLPPGRILDSTTLVQGKYLLDWGAATRDQAFLAHSEKSWGYDPYNMAGHLSGWVFESERRLTILLCRVFDPWFNSIIIKLLVFISFLLGPWLIYSTMRQFGRPPPESLLATAVATVGFVQFDGMSQRIVWEGHHALLLSGYLALFVVGSFYCLMEKFNPRRAGVFFSSFGLLLLLYAPAAGVVILPLAFLFMSRAKMLSLRTHMVLALGFLVVIGLNWHWMGPVLKYRHYFPSTAESSASLGLFFSQYYPYGEGVRGLWSALIRGTLLIMGLGGVALLFNQESKRLGALFCLLLFSAVVLISMGPLIPLLNSAAPKMYILTFSLILIIPVSVFLKEFVLVKGKVRVFYFLWILWFFLTWQIARPSALPALGLGTVSPPGSLTAALKRLPVKGRVLFENINRPNPWQNLLPIITGHEYVGLAKGLDFRGASKLGFFPKEEDKPPKLFEKYLFDYGREELVDILEKYNVTTVVAFTLQGKHLFDRFPQDFKPLDLPSLLGEEFDWLKRGDREPWEWEEPFRIYKAGYTSSGFFLQGSGKVKVTYNKIIIDKPSLGDLVLKYHWFETLITSPDSEIEPFHREGEFLPFIRIGNKAGLKKIIIEDRRS